jgi:putative hydrolase
MTSNPGPTGPEGADGDALRRFLEQTFGSALPPEALEGLDLEALAQQVNLPQDPSMLQAAAAQMQQLFAQQGDGPVNWTLARDLARRTASGAPAVPGMPGAPGLPGMHGMPGAPSEDEDSDTTPGDPEPSPADRRDLIEAANVASLWLAESVDFDMPAHSLEVWTRGTWVQKTLDRWQSITEPVAGYMAGAIGDAIKAQMQEMPAADAGMFGDPGAMMERMGGTLFGIQFGQAIGTLAREVSGTTDLSLPLGPAGQPALVAANVEDLAAANGLDRAAARIFLAARELAHTALFSAAPWLPRALFSAIEDYARGITLDLDALDEMVRDLDLSDPTALQARRPEDLFVFTRRASQERALEELATTLALVEAWVDHVTSQALSGKLPQLEALREVLRRRRAGGSPAEEDLARTIGIELRPRRVREALSWWDSVLATEGPEARDAKWAHPDLLPDAQVLSGTPQAPSAPSSPPTGSKDGADAGAADSFAEEFPTGIDFDAELQRLLDEETGSGSSNDADGDGDGGGPDGGVGGGPDDDPR